MLPAADKRAGKATAVCDAQKEAPALIPLQMPFGKLYGMAQDGCNENPPVFLSLGQQPLAVPALFFVMHGRHRRRPKVNILLRYNY